MDVTDLAPVRLVCLDVDAPVGIPEAEGTVLAAAEAIVPVPVEPDGQNRPLVPLQHVRLLPRQLHPAAAPARHRLRALNSSHDCDDTHRGVDGTTWSLF